MRPNYGATKQLATPFYTSPPIPEERKCSIQQIVSTFIYYSRAVDCTMISYFNKIGNQQAHPTQNTEAEITHFLGYADNNPTTIVQYKSSDMVIHIDSGTSYLFKPWA